VGPQLRVDAGLRQITNDRSLSSLPSSLQTVILYEPYGDLVDGNRGLVEFNDLLKRPLDLNRYLLNTSESATVPLETVTLYLDCFLIGTVNENYLDALKGQPDWASYKGRIELVRMPYLLDYTTEKRIYDIQLEHVEVSRPTAPHVTELASLWAVLTRLRRPHADRYAAGLRSVLGKLKPLEKALLYAHNTLPEGLSGEQARELPGVIPELYAEGAGTSDYEGREGASPREMRTILLNAAQGEDHPCFSPPALFSELKKLVADASLYEFLQLKPDGDYHSPAQFIEVVTDFYLEQVDLEVRSAMGLVEEAQYDQLFGRYVTHVSHWIRKEKLLNPVSGKYEPADQRLMEDVETKLGVTGDREAYRQGVIASIGAFRVEHPNDPVDYTRIFSRQFEVLRKRYFEERKGAVSKIKLHLLKLFDGDVEDLPRQEREQAERTLQALKERFGYSDATAREAIGFLVQRRYNMA
jgi:predicted Ser/Thr protein kinase